VGHRNTKTKQAKAAAIAQKNDTAQLRAFLSKNAQLLLPMLELVTESKRAIDDVIDVAGRAMVEALLVLSAEQLAGPKRQGTRDGTAGPIGWHGTQQGRVALKQRKLTVEKPRLRTRGTGGREVEVPAYDALRQDGKLGERMLDILMAGVSTRSYERVLPEMAASVGVSKSSVSRQAVEASEAALRALLERRFDALDILVVYIDGIIFGEHHVIVAVGVDAAGRKHVLGIKQGATENAVVVKALLEDLVERGLTPERRRLFVVDGSKALRSAITAVFGAEAAVQRCRAHKVRNVVDQLPEHLKDQVKAAMRAAYKLDAKEGIARLKKQASWLEKEYPEAAASLLEGLEETFTINRLGLPPQLMKCLATTNVIENPNGETRRRTNRVSRWRDGAMVGRWAAASYLDAEKHFRKIIGFKDLWMLKAALDEGSQTKRVDAEKVPA
jgi:transposase-like protein